MEEFWESSFRDKQEMWGFQPADCVEATVAFFQNKGLKEILIPGFGYGRNAKIFSDQGLEVTGIEISATAIDLARKHCGYPVTIYHGSVSDMPFDQKLYDGVFCYALIHLLNEKSRVRLIRDCYSQLKPNGYMVFVVISKNTPTFGEGTKVGNNTFATKHGVDLFFYDSESVGAEFGDYGLVDAKEINEPANNIGNKATQRFWQVICKKREG